MILDKTKQIDYKTSDNFTALSHAAAEGKLDFVKALIEKGADININYQTDYSATPLFQAVMNGNEKIAEFLLTNGAKLSDINLMNFGLLSAAINSSLFKLTMKLINDVSEDVINYSGNEMHGLTLISLASSMGQLEIVGKLVKRGADINRQDLITKNKPFNFSNYK